MSILKARRPPGTRAVSAVSRGGRIRTADPRVPNAVRYQLRYTPNGVSIMRNGRARQAGEYDIIFKLEKP